MTKMVTAFRFSEYGGPEKLTLQEINLSTPEPDELQIEQLAIGVNFIDIYHRRGVPKKLPLPSGLGMEGVGIVTAVGEQVTNYSVGDRIAYVGGSPAGYATHRNLPVSRALKCPPGLDDEVIAAMIFKGLTAEYLVHRCVAMKPGDTVLFHAAAGGVGSIACQWLKASGINVIGTVSNEEKAVVARCNGCDEVIIYTQANFKARVLELTRDRGVPVVFDSVGADTFAQSLECLAPRGTLVSFGESSGPVPMLNVTSLGSMGSLSVNRPSIAHYTADRIELEAAAKHLFAAMADGTLTTPKITSYPLEHAAKAQSDMEARRTSGSVILNP